MSALNYYPSLDADGWTNQSVRVLDRLLSDFFLSEKQQSSFFQDIFSLPWYLQQHSDDIEGLVRHLTGDLTIYFSRYFTVSDISVNYETPEDAPSTYSLLFFAKLQDSIGEYFTLNKIVELQNTTIVKISDYMETVTELGG